MDIRLTPEQEAFRDGLRIWLSSNLEQDWDGDRYRGPTDDVENFALQHAWERKLHEGGYGGLHWPTAYGGRGLGIVEYFVLMEELGRVAAPEGINSIGRELVGPIILDAGTEAQKRRFIPRIISADDIWCQGFSEPNSGSDLASVQTFASRTDDGWVINGQKVWTSYAQFSNWCILLCRTDRTVPKHKGMTLFLVPTAQDGLEIRSLRQITGRREFNELFLTEMRIPDSLRLGPVNEGWQVANRVLAFERGTTRLYRQARFAHELRGLARLVLSGAGNKRADKALLFGRLSARLGILRQHNLRIVSRIAAGEAIGPEASLQKLNWSILHQDIMADAGELLGDAFLEHPAAERFRETYLQARAETIYAGTSEIQRSIIADRVLKLPRARKEGV
ncbi:acyl-CoA dehydrogenase family protein [Roseibium sp. CAU 1637]|uniref:Acyl-CoA dehydrogenase family protein n=1 Tax=Roseibium limicola TaxID=2816037 RepID=A0A939EMY4_9HYPH|nr:acyl-CoA dehydrogenase family protein [Roseibium limicola]MBO0344253.1 acyl-CoA dehydrogenase family protein [Roseibium limicola]